MTVCSPISSVLPHLLSVSLSLWFSVTCHVDTKTNMLQLMYSHICIIFFIDLRLAFIQYRCSLYQPKRYVSSRPLGQWVSALGHPGWMTSPCWSMFTHAKVSWGTDIVVLFHAYIWLQLCSLGWLSVHQTRSVIHVCAVAMWCCPLYRGNETPVVRR